MSTFTIQETNPLTNDFNNEYGLPPFSSIKHEHYEPAFSSALSAHLVDIKSIVESSKLTGTKESPATFANTVAPFDRSGSLLTQVSQIFDNLCSSDCPLALQEIQLKMAGPLSIHSSAIYMYPGLFERIETVYEARNTSESNLNFEQIRLIERVYLDFVRAGAKFDSDAQSKYAAIMRMLAELTTKFTQNVMADESSYTIVLKKEDLTGLPDSIINAAKQAAIERSKASDEYVITLSRSLVEPFLTYSDRRDLRETAWKAWTRRGELDPSKDNRQLIQEILKLREEQAQMHGYLNFASYATADTMAGSPVAVMSLLERVWSKAKDSIERERAMLNEYMVQSAALSSIAVETIEPWDWRYYAEKVRISKYDLDESEVKPYFTLEGMVDAIFYCAYKLFRLKFLHRPDLVSYHPDVKTYEVFEEIDALDGVKEEKFIGVFLHDNFARTNKQSGAWMSEYRSQSRNADETGRHVCPIIVNNNNFAKGEPTLLSWDDAKTLFHEFGHGMHGMLSNVTYQRLAGTNVLRDFVELPSQLFEHWLSVPEVLKTHARHYITQEPIPDDLLDRIMKAKNFNKGFETIEYTASALMDQSFHSYVHSSNGDSVDVALIDVAAFEAQELQRLGMPAGMVLRHRPAHFQHLFSGSSYAAGYYVYLWAEVLDADGFDAFLETGDPFDPETAARLRKFIYSSGNSIDPGQAFRLFRGRDPIVEPMMKKKGLLVE